VALLEFLEERHRRLNPDINAIVTTDFENARVRAAAADAALARGEIWGPLHGLPMTIKDSLEVVGMPCTSGAPALADHRPARNADVVASLLEAGAVIFGKTNLPAYAQDFQTFNVLFGRTNNPWDLSLTPGGSSGGAAAALCAGLTPLDIGSDMGGSIRNPAHFCGVFGHRPSIHLISTRGHIPPLPDIFPGEFASDDNISVVGPLARSAEDLDLLMDLLPMPSPARRIAWRIKLPPPRKADLNAYKIGLWLDDPDCPVDRQVGDCLQQLVDRLAAAGAVVTDRRPDIAFARSFDIFWNIVLAFTGAELAADRYAELGRRALNLTDDDQGGEATRLRGLTISFRQWKAVDDERARLRGKWAEYFKEFDVLLCPVVPVTAFPHDHGDYLRRTLMVNGVRQPYARTLAAWAGLIAVAGLPSTVVPVGTARNGLPVGLQIVGPCLEDKTPLHVAMLLEKMTGGYLAPPGYD
jgi:amidase